MEPAPLTATDHRGHQQIGPAGEMPLDAGSETPTASPMSSVLTELPGPQYSQKCRAESPEAV